jgi:hypothetical protein|tara:strand:- start:1686 stop:2246 length:561 start_codon:yes stop_codon:yes gene_type:complete
MVTDLHQMVAPGAEAEVAAGSELGGGNKLTQLKDKFVDLVKEVPGTMKREMEKLCDSLMPVEGEALSDNINGVIKGAFSASARMGSASRRGESGEIPHFLAEFQPAAAAERFRRVLHDEREARIAGREYLAPDRIVRSPIVEEAELGKGFCVPMPPFLDLLPDTTPTPQHVIPERSCPNRSDGGSR